MDFHKVWPHRYLSSKVKSFKSPIDIFGVVAKDKIFKGENILVYGGIIVPKLDILKYRAKLGHAGIQVDDDFFLVPTDRGELKRTGIVNHSCKPDAGFKNSIVLIALRDINKGEEITFDYAFCETYFEPFKCNCQASNCRKIIKSTDCQIKEIQEKYGKYFSPYLKTKIQQ